MPDAFRDRNVDFPKELAYEGFGMTLWNKIADGSYQTAHELEIIQKTADQVVRDLPSPVCIVDLGAANSVKFIPYVQACLSQGKVCHYYPLDLDFGSLVEHIGRFRDFFPKELENNVHGLWGSFEDGDRYFHNIHGSRLFLSLGSIFFNAPDQMCDDRCAQFRHHMGNNDRLVVGQDSPCESGGVSHDYYKSPDYKAFMAAYLGQLQDLAGIKADPTAVWTWESCMESSMHYFSLTNPNQSLVCSSFDNFVIELGTHYRLFKSWKRGAEEIHVISKKNGLTIATLGKSEHSGMTQYLISSRK